jgi:uncharacterized membrane protein YoaK (UPF0700 family)
LTAGFINAIGFLGVHHHGLSHVTGQVTLVSITLADSHPAAAFKAVSVGLWFFGGAILSGVIVQRPELSRRGRRYGVAMVVEGVVLTVATWLLVRGNDQGEYLAAMACGLQNAMATSYSGAVLRTTHVTGIVTDLGILLGHLIRGEPVETRKLGLLAQLLFGFVTGGLGGAVTFHHLGPWSLSVPAVLMLGGGVVFFATRKVLLHRPTTPPQQPAPPRAETAS